MKKIIFVFLLTVLITMIAGSCAGTPKFADAVGKEWKLVEVHIGSVFSRDIIFDRDALTQEGNREIFTLNMDGQIASGVGSPNRYSAPYTLGDGQLISIMPMRSTMMASLFNEPEKLPEHEFFGYMQNVYEWQLTENTLTLLSKTEDGNNVRLIFGL